MKIKSNSDGSKWIEITKALLLFKPYDKTQVICWKAPLKYKFCNFRFKITKYDANKKLNIKNMRCFIRLPFLYWEKSNGGWKFGFTNLYLWWHRARVSSKIKKEFKYMFGYKKRYKDLYCMYSELSRKYLNLLSDHNKVKVELEILKQLNGIRSFKR